MAGTPGSTRHPDRSLGHDHDPLRCRWATMCASDPIGPGADQDVVTARSEIDPDVDHDRPVGQATSPATTASATASGDRSSVSTTRSATDS